MTTSTVLLSLAFSSLFMVLISIDRLNGLAILGWIAAFGGLMLAAKAWGVA